MFPLPFPPPIVEPAAVAETYYADCDGTIASMADLLVAITNGMVNQQIPYSQVPADEWRDCSGNFLRLSSYLASICPGSEPHLAAPAGISDYDPAGSNAAGLAAEARSTRELARWYHQQGRFAPVWYDDAEATADAPSELQSLRHLIKPGAVLWFSHGRPTATDGLEQLFERNNARTHINHMGTVVGVEHDADGQVIGYAMYHGRRVGKLASITMNHRFDSDGRVPPFGHGSQRLVGIGALLPMALPPTP